MDVKKEKNKTGIYRTKKKIKINFYNDVEITNAVIIICTNHKVHNFYWN